MGSKNLLVAGSKPLFDQYQTDPNKNGRRSDLKLGGEGERNDPFEEGVEALGNERR